MEEKLALVRFKNVGKSYYFSTDLDVCKGDKVVVNKAFYEDERQLVRSVSELKEILLDLNINILALSYAET